MFSAMRQGIIHMLTAEPNVRTLAAPHRLVGETRLDFRSAALCHLERVAQRNGARLLIDLKETTDIDASGLGVLILLQKRARERMIATRLLHAPYVVKQMLELTKLAYLFEYED
ncbi:MAG TPA: STAS domain-containing protein [Gemmatimonadaceae bacterium]|nr:STAS domain-containing protein [Gemmatimonadaceae bacterium]